MRKIRLLRAGWLVSAPIFGGVIAAIGVAVLPVEGVGKWACLPLLLDWGGLPMLLYYGVYKREK